jgi:hypothetical protein
MDALQDHLGTNHGCITGPLRIGYDATTPDMSDWICPLRIGYDATNMPQQNVVMPWPMSDWICPIRIGYDALTKCHNTNQSGGREFPENNLRSKEWNVPQIVSNLRCFRFGCITGPLRIGYDALTNVGLDMMPWPMSDWIWCHNTRHVGLDMMPWPNATTPD